MKNDFQMFLTYFFFQKYPSHKAAAEGRSAEKHEFHSLFYHRLGTDQESDPLCVQFPENPDYMM